MFSLDMISFRTFIYKWHISNLSKLFASFFLMKLCSVLVCISTAEACTKSSETQKNNRFKCSFIHLPFKTWNTDNLHCFNLKKNKVQRKKARVKTKKNPAKRPELDAHRGVLWGIIWDGERHRERQKKAKRMGSERWPRFIGCSRLGAASRCSGGSPVLPF